MKDLTEKSLEDLLAELQQAEDRGVRIAIRPTYYFFPYGVEINHADVERLAKAAQD